MSAQLFVLGAKGLIPSSQRTWLSCHLVCEVVCFLPVEHYDWESCQASGGWHFARLRRRLSTLLPRGLGCLVIWSMRWSTFCRLSTMTGNPVKRQAAGLDDTGSESCLLIAFIEGHWKKMIRRKRLRSEITSRRHLNHTPRPRDLYEFAFASRCQEEHALTKIIKFLLQANAALKDPVLIAII